MMGAIPTLGRKASIRGAILNPTAPNVKGDFFRGRISAMQPARSRTRHASRDRCDEETVISALKNYAAGGAVNAPLLADYADKLGIMKTLKPYMEVLL